ncbi:MAG: metallophosphoesterase [Anaerolineales bacterium]|nr:metallophosphoesterase [Anaerolineales bacterium]
MKTISHPSKIIFWLSIFSLLGVSATSPTSVNDISVTKKSQQIQAGNIVFAVIGDYGLAGQNEADVANLVKGWNPDFIVTVGDNNYPHGADSTIDANIGQYYHDYIFRYKGKYGNGSTTDRFFPALGNHDWDQNNGRQQELYFTLPGNERYYNFIQGPVHFFVLNSNSTEPDGVNVNSKQAKWLKKELAASTSEFNIVILHHSPYSSGAHGSTSYMQWPFKTWGADAVLSGHDHIYERILVDGFPYFVNGVGGAELYHYQTILPESQVRFNQDYGAMRVEASSASMKFQFFTRAGILIDEHIIGKTIPSVVSMARVHPNPSNTAIVDFTVTLSEPVTGVDVSDFILTSTTINASISAVNGSGSTYIVSAQTGTGDGTLHLDLIDDDSIASSFGAKLGDTGVGNGNFINGETYNIDKATPSIVSIVRANSNPTSAANVDFIATFSEPVTGVDTSDFSLASAASGGAVINSVNGANNTYTISVNTGSGDNSLRLDFIDNDSITDIAGNMPGGLGAGNGNYGNGETYDIHKSTPSVLSIVRANSNLINTSNADFIVTFSELVTGVDVSDFNIIASTISGAFINSVSGSGNIYTVSTYTGSSDGVLRLELIDNDTIINGSGVALGNIGIGNGNFTNSETYTIDKTAPIVTSIIRASANPSSAPTVDFIVTFSEAVSGVDLSDFSLSTTNISNASINNINNANPFYIVTVNTGVGTGAIRLDLTDDDSITDLAGNKLGGAGASNANFMNGETFSIEKSFPSVTSIIRASNNPSNAPTIDFIVTFSESVNGVDASDFSLSTSNIINASVRSVANFDPFYIVTVNTGIGAGTIRLDLSDDDSISNLAGNRPGGPGVGNGNFVNGESFNIAKNSVNFQSPTLREPKRNFLTNNPMVNFSWAKVRDAQGYEITIATDSNFSQIISNQVVAGLSFTTGLPLYDGIYYWRVRAYDTNLQPGKFSPSNSFTIDTAPPSAPILLTPIDNLTISRKPKFSWEKLDAATKYQIEIDNNSDFSSPEWAALREETKYQASFIRRGTYFWRVRARDMAGNWGNWSPAFRFTFP